MNDPEARPLFCITLTGAESAVREGLAEAMSSLAPLSLSVDEAGTVELVLAEALNNVVEHALAATDGKTMIEISGTHDRRGLRLSIIDEGAPMPKGQTPDAKAPDVDVADADMPEGGFGWFMIHTLATNVQYSRVGDCNHLTLRLAVGI
ncbi:ATP-binding protein [uncultured Sulfitobacter sp.]|uniref:ATP-binding protein n=1 Tax=uncultured Sulfitobacter sp. TaxID=191468 RepID=UPI0026250CD7|nr:ATP-binding protein [uncultured Sulfitobacter sp.]